MSDITILPENVNNEDSDFLFQKKLYIGLGDQQFEIRDRFQLLELATEALGLAVTNNTQFTSEFQQLLSALQNQVSGINTSNEAFVAHLDNFAIHVDETLKNHPSNILKHVPAAGVSDDVLSAITESHQPVWRKFFDLLPEKLRNIVTSNQTLSTEELVQAFRTVTLSAWMLSGQPLGNTRIKAIASLNRFIVGGSNGKVASTFDGNYWFPAETLFSYEDGLAAAVEAIASVAASNGNNIFLALDAYSDFRIAVNESGWSPRLSVNATLVEELSGETIVRRIYTDRYATADFTCAIAGGGYFLLFTTKGTVYSASYDQVIAEFQRSKLEHYDRHSTVWEMQESNESVTQGTTCCAYGGGYYVAAGILGRIAISTDRKVWTEVSTSPFGSTINSVVAGEDRFVAVSNTGKIGYAMFTNPTNWTLIPTLPFSERPIHTVTFGAGVYLANGEGATINDAGITKYSKDSIDWFDVGEADLIGYGTASNFGDTYFMVGDQFGNIKRSLSLASIFSVVTRSEFQQLMYEFRLWWDGLVLPSNDPDNPDDVDYSGLFKTVTLLEQLNRKTNGSKDDPFPPRSHDWGVPILDQDGKLFASNQTWQRGEPDGIAPLDANNKVPADYLDVYDLILFMRALRNEMTKQFTLLSQDIFSNQAGYSRINDSAYSPNWIVLVGERGRMVGGAKIKDLQLLTSPFDNNESVVSVARGFIQDEELWVAISQRRYSTSTNGKDWSDAIELSTADLQAVNFCGGYFLIVDVAGNIWRNTSELGNETDSTAAFEHQETSPLVTQGVKSTAYFEGKYYGVGAANKITVSEDAIYWDEEQSPCPADTVFNDVCTVDGAVIAVGNYGRIIRKVPNAENWTISVSPTNQHLYSIIYDFDYIIVSGANGVILTSFFGDAWTLRQAGTNAILRTTAYFNKRFITFSDLGQFFGSLTIADILGLFDEFAPSYELPKPLADVADAGEVNQYSRGDHVHPDTGVVMEKRVGKPTTYKTKIETIPNPENPDETIDIETEVVDRYGVPPLDRDGIIPKEFLPPLDLDNIFAQLKYNFDFIEIEPSPFEAGSIPSSVIIAGADAGTVAILVGDHGIAKADNLRNWSFVETELGESPIDCCVAYKGDNTPILCVVTNHKFAYSEDATDWTIIDFTGQNYDFADVSFYQNKITVTSSTGVILRATPDEMEFAMQESGTEYSSAVTRCVGGNGLWVAVGTDGKILQAVDASHFNSVESPTTVDLLCLAAGKGGFIACGQSNTIIAKIGNGSWQLWESPLSAGVDIITCEYLPSIGGFIIANQGGELAITYDLLTWERIDSPSQESIRSISTAFDNIILGNDIGEIFSSKQYITINGNISGGGGGNGTNNYNDLINKPKINGVELIGDFVIDTEKYIAGNNIEIVDGTAQNAGKKIINAIATTGGGDVDLSNYYTKNETYTQSQVDTAISSAIDDIEIPSLTNYYTKNETYSKLEINSKLVAMSHEDTIQALIDTGWLDGASPPTPPPSTDPEPDPSLWVDEGFSSALPYYAAALNTYMALEDTGYDPTGKPYILYVEVNYAFSGITKVNFTKTVTTPLLSTVQVYTKNTNDDYTLYATYNKIPDNTTIDLPANDKTYCLKITGYDDNNNPEFIMYSLHFTNNESSNPPPVTEVTEGTSFETAISIGTSTDWDQNNHHTISTVSNGVVYCQITGSATGWYDWLSITVTDRWVVVEIYDANKNLISTMEESSHGSEMYAPPTSLMYFKILCYTDQSKTTPADTTFTINVSAD